MTDPSNFILFALGAITGGAAAWLAARMALLSKVREERLAREMESKAAHERIGRMEDAIQRLESEAEAKARALDAKREENAALRAEIGKLEERLRAEQEAAAEKLALLERAREELSRSFQALSGQALERNNKVFLDLALQTLEAYKKEAAGDLVQRQKAIEELARPIRESLSRVDQRLSELEKAREGAYRAISEQVRALIEDHLPMLHRETQGLIRALRQPQVRGRWGEIQLRRVVEMAGMVPHCDFIEQHGVNAEKGVVRPDLVVNLPGGRKIVVDAKTPLASYLEAVECAPPEQERKLGEHVANIRKHIEQLASKGYWEHVSRELGRTPEFVIMFLPGESFFTAAVRYDAGLLEYGASKGVILATPLTLISVLKAVAHAWQQEAIAENAQRIAELGRELYNRIYTLSNHWVGVGKGLKQAVEAFNRATGTLESRVLVGARRFVDLEAAPKDKEIKSIEPLEVNPRELTKLDTGDE